jgi:hypothetical protein
MAVPPNIPVCLKHNTLAIYQKGKGLSGAGATRFESAFSIARDNLVKYGYLSPASKAEGVVEQIRLTGKGHDLERKKRNSPGTSQKQAEFDRLFEAWQRTQEGSADGR